MKETENRKDGNLNMTMDDKAYLNTQLYEKVCAEMTELEQKLLSLPPEEILLHAYEYVIKQDIVFALQEYDVSEKQAGILLKSGNALEDIFGKYENSESDYMVHIQDVIECTANEKLRQAFLSERKAGRER